jgi:hypothetical protein
MPPKQQFTLADGAPLTRQESFVLRQVAAGEIADLKQQFGEAEADRRLRARFLEELLTGELKGVKIHRHGLQIINGVVEQTLNLENVEVAVGVWLDGCIFKEAVNFMDAAFLGHLILNDSDFCKMANFHRLKVAANLFCRNTTFGGPVDFGGGNIKGNFFAEGAKFLSLEGDANFNAIQVGKHNFFNGAEFHRPVDFGTADIKGQFSANGAKFLSREGDANFNAMQVGLDAFFRGAEFHGPVDFGGADIKRQFSARGAKFLSQDGEANLNAIQVGQDARFDMAEFHGPVDFAGANITRQFVAMGAKFLSSKHRITFYRMHVGHEAVFQGCDFHGIVSFVLIRIAGNFHLDPLERSGPSIATTFHSDVNLRGADIGGELLADKAHFLGHIVNFEAVKVGRSFHASGALFGGTVNFREMQVRNNFYVDPFGRMKSFKTLFKGAANFSDLEVHGVFNADQAIFQSESTIFSGLKVGQAALFNGTIFFGGLVLKEGQLTDLVIRGLHRLSKGGLPLDEIVLNRTKIAHRLTIEDVEVKRFDARNLEVKGPAELSRLFIRDEADLRDAACHHLQVAEIDWPEPRDGKEKTYLDGLAYQSITTKTEPDKPEKWRELLDWLGSSRFNTQNFQELDAFFQRGGLRKWADKVHIAGKRRELWKMKWWHPARWLTRFFWGLLAGYGRKPGRVLWISLGLIILGALILNPAEVLPPDFLNDLAGYQDNVVHRMALRLIVSFFSFVAAIPGWGSHLSVTSHEFHLFVYLWFQRICGWILIPIGLAAVYTRLK